MSETAQKSAAGGRQVDFMNPMQIEVVGDPERLKALEPAWRDLCSRVPDHGFYQTFGWNWRGWEHIDSVRGRTLHIVVGTVDGRVVLIWPLVVYRVGAWRTAGWVGTEGEGYGDVLVEPGPHAAGWLRTAWDHIASGAGLDVASFRNVRADATVASVLSGTTQAARTSAAAPFVAWDESTDWESYYRTIKSKLRSDQRRQRRLLGEKGELTYDHVATAADADGLLDWMFAQKAAWLARKGMTGRWFDSAEHHDFVRAAIRAAHEAGQLYFATLSVGRTVIAADVAFRYNDRLHGCMFAYDLEWEAYSPGRLLVEESLRWACSNGIRVFDFKPIGESYKYIWARGDIVVTSHLVPCSAWGGAYCAWFGSSLRAWAEKLYYAIPRGPRRLIGNALLR